MLRRGGLQKKQIACRRKLDPACFAVSDDMHAFDFAIALGILILDRGNKNAV